MNYSMAYGNKNFNDLLNTNLITKKTKQVLVNRINEKEEFPLFFTAYQFNILTIVCDLLMAQNSAERICNPAIAIDKRLAAGKADGWRYDVMPDDRIALVIGIDGIDEFAFAMFKKPFQELYISDQIYLLEKIQRGETIGNNWKEIIPALFFEELLVEVTAVFYSHPVVQHEIGFVGMADANGWKNIGLNSKDIIESDEIIFNKIS
uniref:Gluconate 2-dehydrogenase subunit 3 family protein n=1 Tax=uncultured bacterium fCS1 TaxID=585280 RepID=C3U0R5_9BACT|nr:hypothetical protein [uncultured bacterium fCS1]